MKLLRKRGDTSNILQIFVSDSSSTTGAGLTGLVFNTAGLTAYYHRDLDTTATAITLVTMTVGTFTSSGFKEIDATNMPGWYQFCPPDAAFGSGTAAHSVGFLLKGATNMAPLPIECQLIAVDVEDTIRGGLTSLPNVASGSAGAIPTTGTGANQIAVSSGQVILQAGTGTGQLDFTAGVVNANATQFAGQTITAAAGVTIPSSIASPTNITAGTITTVTNLTNAPTAGDLTATMKSSVTTACTASTPTAAAVTGSVGSVTAGVTVTTNNDKTGYTASTVTDKTGYSIATGGIGSGAHTAAELNNIADAGLDRNMTAGTDSGTDLTIRTPRQALRELRNKVAIVGGTQTTYKENDITVSHTKTVATTAGNPISSVTPV